MSTRPIGVFDSGIGGLSILRALRARLPSERFLYLADNGYAPYGEREPAFVVERALAIAGHLIANHDIKAFVVACNTATAAAIHLLRERHPELPIVGVEPPLKPASQSTRTGRVGVMATRGTLESAKFRKLLDAMPATVQFVLQACDGLARAIEIDDPVEIELLCRRYVGRMGEFGAQAGQIDSLVLGCTHYPFAEPVLRLLVGPEVHILDSGDPVARQTHRLLEQHGLLSPAAADFGPTDFAVTGEPETLTRAVHNWFDLDTTPQRVTI